uniref:N-acetylmuramoyl-L-alanine amidase n=1 Tax=Psychromonas hadalis TaxID=211669 RepID=UPI0003B631D1
MKLTHNIFIKQLFIISFLLLAFSSVHANQLKGARAWPSPDNTRVVLDLMTKPNYEIHYLKRPDRLVIDIKSTTSKINLKKIAHKGPLVKNIRESGSESKGTYRLVIDLKQPSKAKIFTLPPAKPYGHRLVIDLPHQAPKIVPKPNKTQKNTQPTRVGRDVIIAIDAGHGGDDPGAIGRFSYEKKITLQIAKRLQKRINQQAGMNAFLIRTGDYYVNLNKRSELAVNGKADFLVSIHADGFSSSQPSGASVWILSDRRANSEMGRRMERHEVHSELLGGKGESSKSAGSVPFLNKVFFDMSKSNSMQVGSDVGSLVAKELKQITKMHKKKPVGASLAVLKSPYIPSILVEAGFITNHREERLLNQADFQNRISNAVFKGIYRHFRESPPHDSLFAQKRRAIKHTVRSGESLSILAARYSVSASELKSHNRLKSSALRIGQVLKIPSNYQLVVKRDPIMVVPVKTSILTQVKVHKVKSGESLSVIAKRYGSTTNELKNYNKLRSTSLAIGQKIKIPTRGYHLASSAVNTPIKATVHKVRSGESLSVIAKRYGKTTSE